MRRGVGVFASSRNRRRRSGQRRTGPTPGGGLVEDAWCGEGDGVVWCGVVRLRCRSLVAFFICGAELSWVAWSDKGSGCRGRDGGEYCNRIMQRLVSQCREDDIENGCPRRCMAGSASWSSTWPSQSLNHHTGRRQRSMKGAEMNDDSVEAIFLTRVRQ